MNGIARATERRVMAGQAAVFGQREFGLGRYAEFWTFPSYRAMPRIGRQVYVRLFGHPHA